MRAASPAPHDVYAPVTRFLPLLRRRRPLCRRCRRPPLSRIGQQARRGCVRHMAWTSRACCRWLQRRGLPGDAARKGVAGEGRQGRADGPGSCPHCAAIEHCACTANWASKACEVCEKCHSGDWIPLVFGCPSSTGRLLLPAVLGDDGFQQRPEAGLLWALHRSAPAGPGHQPAAAPAAAAVPATRQGRRRCALAAAGSPSHRRRRQPAATGCRSRRRCPPWPSYAYASSRGMPSPCRRCCKGG